MEKQLLTDVVFPEHSQEVQMLLYLLDGSCGVCSPGEVNRDHGAQEGEGVDPLYVVTLDVEGEELICCMLL